MLSEPVAEVEERPWAPPEPAQDSPGLHKGRLQLRATVHLAGTACDRLFPFQYVKCLRNGPGGAGGEEEPARYLWLPVAGPKRDRTALRARLPAALAFVLGHLARGRRVLVHCDDGADRCVCVALAALLAGCCISQEADAPVAPAPQSMSAAGHVSQAAGLDGSPQGAGFDACSEAGPQEEGVPGSALGLSLPMSAAPAAGPGTEFQHRLGSGSARVPGSVSRCELRRQLAAVGACYPPARPSSDMLRQVFNYFRS